MTNNDVLRSLRYTFDFSDPKLIDIFAQADQSVEREEITNWLKRNDEEGYRALRDKDMAVFLNGFINLNRGKKEGPARPPEQKLNNNIIFTKLKIAMNLKAEDVLEILDLSEIHISKHELSAFFRKPGHKHFRECKDQILRHFLKGLQLRYREKAG